MQERPNDRYRAKVACIERTNVSTAYQHYLEPHKNSQVVRMIICKGRRMVEVTPET